MHHHVIVLVTLVQMFCVATADAMWTQPDALEEPASKRRAVGESGVPVSTASFLQAHLSERARAQSHLSTHAIKGLSQRGKFRQESVQEHPNLFATWSASERDIFHRVIASNLQKALDFQGLYGSLEQEIIHLLWQSQPFVSPVFREREICWQSVAAHFPGRLLGGISKPDKDKVSYFFKGIFEIAASQIAQPLAPLEGLDLLAQYKHTPLPIVRPISSPTSEASSSEKSLLSAAVATSLFPDVDVLLPVEVNVFQEPSASNPESLKAELGGAWGSDD